MFGKYDGYYLYKANSEGEVKELYKGIHKENQINRIIGWV